LGPNRRIPARGALSIHFRLPKPLHGWRAFVGEVGIIVVGVLIALGAEQLVQQWQWQNRVRETTHELDAELYRDGEHAYTWLVAAPCIDGQLDRIDAALAAARRTGHLDPTPQFTPPLGVFTQDAWLNARALQVADHLSSEQLRQYSQIFVFAGGLSSGVVELHEQGAELRSLTPGASPISSDEVGAYQRQAGRVRELLDVVELSETLLLTDLKRSGIQLSQEDMDGDFREATKEYGSRCTARPDLNRKFEQGG
jgi:hypothetical protein